MIEGEPKIVPVRISRSGSAASLHTGDGACGQASTESQRAEEFLELLQRHRDQLFGFILSLVTNLSDAEDLFQQTSLALWRDFDRFERGTDFIRWSCIVARFHALNFLKQRRRHQARFSEGFVMELAAEQEDRWAEVDQRRSALTCCLAKLPKADRQLIDRCYQGDRSIKQVAEQAQGSVQATYNALSRIRRTLRTCIERTLAAEMHP